MILQIVLLVLGLLLLIKGADWLVEGASAIARKKKISDLAIGLTIVAFGTSAPELVVNVVASLRDQQDIVFGNVIGSNNFNLYMILGIAGLITPLTLQSGTVFKEIPVSLFAGLLLFVLANSFITDESVLFRMDGMILLVFFLLFLYYVYTQLRSDPEKTEVAPERHSIGRSWILIALSLTGLIIGGRFVVTSAVDIASALGESEKLIGLTIVAAGTSLPELATSIVAAQKKEQ